MEITGKIIHVLPEVGGISKAGNEWKKQEYVLETHDLYPKKICFQIFGADRIAQANIQAGQELTVTIEIESREYQGRWYTSINARDVRNAQQMMEPETKPMDVTPDNFAPTGAPTATSSAAPDFGQADPIDDLPF